MAVEVLDRSSALPITIGNGVQWRVAVAVETKMDGKMRVEQTQAFRGLSTFPYSAANYAFSPIIGSPYSAVQQSATVCT